MSGSQQHPLNLYLGSNKKDTVVFYLMEMDTFWQFFYSLNPPVRNTIENKDISFNLDQRKVYGVP